MEGQRYNASSGERTGLNWLKTDSSNGSFLNTAGGVTAGFLRGFLSGLNWLANYGYDEAGY
jgi:hypothetical protein